MNKKEIANLNERKVSLNHQLEYLFPEMEKARRRFHSKERLYNKVRGNFESIDRKLAMEDGRHQVVESKETKKKLKSEKETAKAILSLGKEAIQKLIDELKEDYGNDVEED